jgi:hypothetical protein
MLLRSVHKLIQLRRADLQRKHFFDNNGLADHSKGFQRGQCLGDLSLLGIDVYAEEVELIGNLCRHEAGSQPRPL